jgi:hypothetical protein
MRCQKTHLKSKRKKKTCIVKKKNKIKKMSAGRGEGGRTGFDVLQQQQR